MIDLSKYNKILNKSIVSKVRDVIYHEMEEIYVKDGLCKYASNNISLGLNNNHILNKIIDIKDITNIDYSHEFIIAFDNINNNYILIDPTYEQFINSGEELNDKFRHYPNDILISSEEGKIISDELIKNNFMVIDDDSFYLYVNSFDQNIDKDNIKLDDIFLNFKKGDENENIKRIR